jgi:hypothetical protein
MVSHSKTEISATSLDEYSTRCSTFLSDELSLPILKELTPVGNCGPKIKFLTANSMVVRSLFVHVKHSCDGLSNLIVCIDS